MKGFQTTLVEHLLAKHLSDLKVSFAAFFTPCIELIVLCSLHCV